MAAQSKKSQKRKLVEGRKVNKASKKPFKSERSSKSPALSAAVALQLEDDAPDFPRGGESALSHRESNAIQADSDPEFVAKKPFSKKNKRKKEHKKNNAEVDDLGSLFGGGVLGKLPKCANKITLKNISPGMKLWGVVAEVNEKDIVISLPGGLRGLVRATDALDPVLNNETEDIDGGFLTSIFYSGQLVSCVVLRLDEDRKENGKRKIWLSLRLSLLHKGFNLDAIQEGMVLNAYVRSIEDHGCILHFGMSSFTGFLSQKNRDERCKVDLRTGQLIQGVVRSIDRIRRVVYLSSDPDTVSRCVTKDLKGISIDLLVPGMMVNARVQAVLENGIMLSFLTYFTGTADIFHLQDRFPNKNWRDDYSQNKKVVARILFIDPSSRAIGLTLNPHLVGNQAPHLPIKTGGIYEEAKVTRIDKGAGLLLEVPTNPLRTPAYVNVSDATEDATQKLEKRFKEGNCVRVRILALRHLEGLAIGVLKATAFEDTVFTHSDVKPGMVVKAKVVAVESFGAIVQFPGGIKALCPLRHMSELEVSNPGKKFKVGAELVFRVLGCKSKRITVTHKKTLVKSKLPVLSSYAEAIEGLVTHGCIAKIEKHGCFIRFYNGVKGFAPREELGMEPGSDPESIYHVGQVVKCRVTSSVAAIRRINLSFNIKPTRASEGDVVKLGSVVSGTVDRITPHSVVISLNAKGYIKGMIPTEHLADHHEHAVLMKSLLKLGYQFDQLLVIDNDSSRLLLSAKHSLLSRAQELPSDICQIHPNSVVHGYICNLIDTGCFVRFLGRVTGFSPRSKATDDLRNDLSEAFYVGQSVRSAILDVNREANRITLSLKQSCCSSTDASFINEYFLFDEKIARMQLSSPSGPELKWMEEFKIGSFAEGRVQEIKDLGVVVGFEQYSEILGFIPRNQLGETTLKLGFTVRAVVLDVSKAEGLIDLTLKPEFIKKPREGISMGQKQKKRGREAYEELELHQTVNAVVEIVKDHYLVLSVPEYSHAIGFASLYDYNTQKLPRQQYLEGQSVVASVAALPTPSSLGRLLLLLKSVTVLSETSRIKKAKKKSNYSVGSLIQAEITEIKPVELRLKFGVRFQGRIHITEVTDSNSSEQPFSNFRVGQTVTARITEKPKQSDSWRSNLWELSVKPATLTGSSDFTGPPSSNGLEFSAGQRIRGYVYRVENEWAWIAISRNFKAQLFVLDSACEPSELKEFQRHFYLGKAVCGYALSVNKERLRIVQRPVDIASGHFDAEDDKVDKLERNPPSENIASYIHEGDILGGRISKILPGVGGLIVQIGPHAYGRVHYTELKDSWVPDPLADYSEGQFVKCKVLELRRSGKGTIHVDLSLRSSLEGMGGQVSSGPCSDGDNVSKHIERIEDLHPDMVVQGYVKNIMAKGCFVVLSRKLEAKILLSNLSDGYVEDPQKEFPIGRLVSGRVSYVETLSKRVEITLKTGNSGNAPKSKISDFGTFRVGETISGRIKRVESFGLFITIDNSDVVGLCHVSEISDDRIENIGAIYRIGEKAKAKILKVDKERHRISLGMKNSYIKDDSDHEKDMKQESTEAEVGDYANKTESVLTEVDSLSQGMATETGDGASHVLAKVESRAFIPPLEVDLGDIEQSEDDNIGSQGEEHLDGKDPVDVKNKRREKKKAKEEREREIRAAEERLLKEDVPRTADEFEKLVRSSPNSSFVWIKYMAFMLSLADYEKARALAERALRTINIREEDEKLNIWVAYFNLENEHGHPPEEAVSKVFQRALQSCDPKKIHLALLGLYERTQQNKLADELLGKMTKKFKQSCKVWLRRVQGLLKQNQDGVQSIVNRAIMCLPKHKHIKFISQTAILEFKCGVPDRGRSLFEGILREYPKRTDLWSVYLDQEIRHGDVDVIRSLFERAISLSLPPKKMKFLFKKYLEYEKCLGDDERIEGVKQKALEYVTSAMA